MKNTRSVNLEMMKNHGKAVVSNAKKSMTIIDMPYKTYRNKKEALKNALDILTYTKADFIKIETDHKNVAIVKYLTENKIKVVSHIGITPQKFSDFSKIKSVGKNLNESNHLIKLAKKLEDAGLIKVRKKFEGNYPLTLCKITSKGKTSFKFFLNSLQSYGINESADVDFKK